jgi:hypothetical protein
MPPPSPPPLPPPAGLFNILSEDVHRAVKRTGRLTGSDPETSSLPALIVGTSILIFLGFLGHWLHSIWLAVRERFYSSVVPDGPDSMPSEGEPSRPPPKKSKAKGRSKRYVEAEQADAFDDL